MYANTTEERIEYKSIVWPLLDWGAPFPEAADFEMISRDVTANYGCSMVSTPKAKFDPLTDVIFILYIHFQEMRLVKTKRKTKRADVSLQEILLLLTWYSMCFCLYVMIPIFAQHIFLWRFWQMEQNSQPRNSIV